jgi:hypothetical protein
VARVAGLLAIAVLSIFVLHAFNSSLDNRLNALHVSPGVRQLLEAQRNKLAGAQVPVAAHGPLHAAMQHAIAAAFVDSFHLAMWIGAALALTSALCAFLLVEGKPTPKNQ